MAARPSLPSRLTRSACAKLSRTAPALALSSQRQRDSAISGRRTLRGGRRRVPVARPGRTSSGGAAGRQQLDGRAAANGAVAAVAPARSARFGCTARSQVRRAGAVHQGGVPPSLTVHRRFRPRGAFADRRSQRECPSNCPACPWTGSAWSLPILAHRVRQSDQVLRQGGARRKPPRQLPRQPCAAAHRRSRARRRAPVGVGARRPLVSALGALAGFEFHAGALDPAPTTPQRGSPRRRRCITGKRAMLGAMRLCTAQQGLGCTGRFPAAPRWHAAGVTICSARACT